MYRPTNYLEKKPHATPALPRVSTVSVKWSNPFDYPTKAPPAIQTSRTMPHVTSGTMQQGEVPPDIQRSSSGGFFLQRKRSSDERKASSGFRAAELMAQYEMADEEEKQEQLVREADFKTNTIPTMGSALAGQRALLAQAEKNRKDAEQKRRVDAALGHGTGTSTTTNVMRHHADSTKARDRLDVPKKKTKAQQRIEIAQATRIRLAAEMAAAADQELPGEVGVEVSPSSSSSKPTIMEQQQQQQHQQHFHAPKSPRSVVHHSSDWRTYSDTHVLC